MGSTESSEGRRVSFCMDEEERVRVLQGIRLSENVVKRMKDPSPASEGQRPVPPPASGSPGAGSQAPQREAKLPRWEASGGQQPLGVNEDLKRFQQEQATVQDELLQAVKREREAAARILKASPPQGGAEPDKQKAAQLAGELEKREAELGRRDAFYKEQLGRFEKKNAEMFKLSSQQFHEAASKAEHAIKPRRVEPVCSGLQAQILRCYRDHLQEVLQCSDLVKAYQHCVSAAHKG